MEAPAMRAMRGDHTPQAMATMSASNSPDASCLDVDPEDLGVGQDLRAFLLGSLAHDRSEAERVDDRHGGGEEAAEQDRLIDDRDELFDLCRRYEPATFDTPGFGRRHPAPQLLHPFLGARDLDAAALVQRLRGAVLAHRFEGELCHLLGMVDREDEVRGMAGRAAGVRERSLVDLNQVDPAELREPSGKAVADDAAADHDDLHTVTRTLRIACSKSSTCARIRSAARSGFPTTISRTRSRCISTASCRSSAWSSESIQMRRART